MNAPARPYRTRLQVRFPEVDSYGVVWHGHYLAYMEVVRNEVCAAGGLSPATSLAAGYKLPITRFEVFVKSSARLEDELDVEATLRPPRTARLEVDYAVRRAGTGKLLATGVTEQVVLNPSGELLLTLPGPLKILVDRILRWQQGEETLPGPAIILSS